MLELKFHNTNSVIMLEDAGTFVKRLPAKLYLNCPSNTPHDGERKFKIPKMTAQHPRSLHVVGYWLMILMMVYRCYQHANCCSSIEIPHHQWLLFVDTTVWLGPPSCIINRVKVDIIRQSTVPTAPPSRNHSPSITNNHAALLIPQTRPQYPCSPLTPHQTP